MNNHEDLLAEREEMIVQLKAITTKLFADLTAAASSADEVAAAVKDAAGEGATAAGIVTVVKDLAVTLRAAADRAAAHERAADRVETIEVAQRRAVVPKATEDYVDAPEVAAENTAAPEAVNESAAALDGGMDGNNTHPPLDKIKDKQNQAHEEMVGVLVKRGAVEGIIEQSWDTKRANVGVVVHDEQQLVLDYILTDCNSGIFRRTTIHREKGDRIVFWQHFLKGTRVVNYLLRIKAVRHEGSGQCVAIESEDEKNIPKEAKMKLVKIATSTNAQRARVKDEETMLDGVRELENELYEKGKRVKGTLQEGVDKYLWRDGDNVWGAFGVTADKSAEGMLAELSLSETYTYARRHLEDNGNLPRVLRQNVDGTRSLHQHQGVHLPNPAKDRLFESWFSWKEVKLENGRTSYMLAFVPLTEYPERGFKDLSKEGFVLAETTGVYFFNEIAPNVCRMTRIQTVDLKFTGLLQKAVMDKAIDFLAKSQLVEANMLQEKFRRNGKEVDAEVRGVLVERMKDSLELSVSQKKVFENLEEFFGSEKQGWKSLQSPFEGVKMEFKHQQHVKDAGGHIPVSLVNRNMPYALSTIKAVSDTFAKDGMVDEDALKYLVNIIKNEPQDYSEEEKVAIRKAKEIYEKCKDDEKFDELKSPDERVKMKLVHVDGASSGSGFATTVVDASVEECAANEITSLNSRNEMKKAKMNGITTMKVVNVNPHTFYYITTRKLGIPGFVPRDGRSKVTWFKQHDGKAIIYFTDTEDLKEEFPVKTGNVTVKGHSVWVFEPLDPVGGVPQTSVTFTTKVDLGGVVFSSIVNKIAPSFLAQVSDLRKKFDRSRDIDASTRIQIVRGIGEIKAISTETFDTKSLEVEGKQKVEGAFPLADTWLKVEEKGKGWGKTTVTVRAGLKEAAAYFWDFESKVNQETTGDVERVIEEKKGTWEVVVRRKQKLESKEGVKNKHREFWNVMKLHKMDENTIVITMEPIMENMERSDAVSNNQTSTARKASEEVAIKFTKRGEKATKVEFVTKVELGSSVSVEATKTTLERHLDEAAEAQRYFIDLIPLKEMSKQIEGKAL
ncbi:hypothetical protein TrCOL_g5426 [Triparma columacea]|uniref:Uncharacterized protein n=1 Tax=Triparma columacea TaxID=722753 RepID=A0A9W7GMU2_9STRA|nr:hypothetical protein TrCOL_g5426 [Triparma columacea]